MKIRFFIAVLIFITFIIVGKAQAVKSDNPFALPKDAEKISEDTFKLRPSKDPGTGETVEAFAFVHKKTNFKDAPARSQGSLKNSISNCYGYLANGAKWKWVEPWVVNATNSSSLTQNFIFNTLNSDISKWEDATDGVLGNGVGVNVIGDGTTTSSALLADTVSPDNVNEVYFGSIEDPNTIAVTIVWGIFSGPPFQRKLVEWDQIYSNAYNWSSSGEAGKMDFNNIGIHELGHSFGMNDLYTSFCSEQTMYGYASLGETKKTTLEVGDINGINKFY
jgi:hypothetical protein